MDPAQSIRQKPSSKLLGERLFSFAVIADTHLNQSEAECNSPFEVNRLANGRLRHVIRDLNSRGVDFVINLGDLVHPVPAFPELYDAAAALFLEQVRELEPPLHLVPGNHDVGDKPIAWGPAGVVRDQFLDAWKRHFGAHFYAFTHNACRFIVINAQIINSGLAAEAEQRAWLEHTLADGPDQRTFLCSHYPPYLTAADEGEHYDNLAEPGRSWLLSLLEAHKIEALFAGHVHNFWYHRHVETDCYILPSTAFVRHDYSEMYRVEPGPEAGRNDTPKLGYFLVQVHARGHSCHVIRTYGAVAGPSDPAVHTTRRVTPLHPRENRHAPLGFDMRQNWTELVEIPPTGGLDEFDRKLVRNDYPLLAIWEAGLRKLRIPLRDLESPRVRDRLYLLSDHGQDFTVFSYGPPTDHQRDLLIEHRELIEAWEVGFALEDAAALADALLPIKQAAGLTIYLTRLRSKADLLAKGEKYYHMINHGFAVTEGEQIEGLLKQASLASAFDGVVFRAPGEDGAWQAIRDAGALASRLGILASVHLRMATDNPAEARLDDRWTAERIAEALAAALTLEDLRVFVDTFADIDRGYFVRNGIVDRRYNPRPAFHVLRHLHARLNADPADLMTGETIDFAGGRGLSLAGSRQRHLLLFPETERQDLRVPRSAAPDTAGSDVLCCDLYSGELTVPALRVSGDGQQIVLGHRISGNPVLITWPSDG